MNHIHSNKSKYLYEDTSNKLLSKLTLVNTLTSREIGRLNDFYIRNGLYMKQVKVDIFGNELFTNNDINAKAKEKRRKRAMMTLKEFYNKYYYVPTLANKKKTKKLLQKKKKRGKIEFNESIDYSDMNEESSVDEEYLKNLRKNLKDIYNDIQNIEYKDCKITDNNFKEKVIDYILKFRNFVSDKQYLKLLNKWKNELITIKGVNPLDQDSLNDLSTWKMPILKGLKSEIVLLAMANVLGKNLGEQEVNNEEDEEKEKEKEKSEDKKKDEESEESSDSFSDIDSFNNKNINDNMDNDDNENMEQMERNEISRKIIEDM